MADIHAEQDLPDLLLHDESSAQNYQKKPVPSACRLPFYSSRGTFAFVVSDWANDHSLSLTQHKNVNTFWHQVNRHKPPVAVLGVDQSLLENGLLAKLATSKNRPIIVSVINSADEALLTECYQQGADRVVATPFCSAKIFQALLKALVTRDHCYPPYHISSKIQTVSFGNTQVRLRKKPFDLAQYLFMNHGQLIPRSKILDDLWGLDGKRCSTRRIDVHICHIRRQLALDGSHGWEIRTSRQSGYGLFRITST